MKVSISTQGMQPSIVRMLKRQNGICATPAGSEMNVRMIGSIRVKKTVASPCFSNQRSAHSRWLFLMCSFFPCFSSRSTRPIFPIHQAIHEPTRFATDPTIVAANRLYSPRDTLKPANSMVASLGTGMQALSRSIRMKTPLRPIASTTSTATSTIGSVSEAMTVIEPGRVAGRLADVPLFATSLEPYHDRLSAAMDRVARSGRYILGPEVEAFEREFAEYLGV